MNAATIEQHPLETQFEIVTAPLAEFNKTQDNPFGFPEGFFKATDRKGQPAGFGFYCQRCRLTVPGGLDKASIVKHCGKRERIPEGLSQWLKLLFSKPYKHGSV
jgi:hypothetical protein